MTIAIVMVSRSTTIWL